MNRSTLRAHLWFARRQGLPATLTLEEWTCTISHFMGLCAYCQEKPVEVLEHFVPVRHGGGTTVGNCLPACQQCNARKRSVKPDSLGPIFGPDRCAALRSYLQARSSGQDVGPAITLKNGGGFAQFNIRMPDDLIAALDEEVEEQKRLHPGRNYNRSDLIREVLYDHVEHHRPEHIQGGAAKTSKRRSRTPT